MRFRCPFGIVVLAIGALAPITAFAQLNQVPIISTTQGGVVSGTYGYFKYVSATYGIGGSSDRIVSGTSVAIINPNGNLTVRGLLDVVTGTGVVAVGYQAGNNVSSTDTDRFTALGYQAAQNTSYATGLTAVGYAAAQNSVNGINTVVGTQAAQNNRGNNVNVLGFNAGQFNVADTVVAMGNNAAMTNTGAGLIALGDSAGYYNSGANVTAVGVSAGSANTFSNVTLLGSGVLTADKDNQVVLGNSSTVEISTSGVYVGKGLKASGVVTATYFEGDGSRLTNPASSDRIVSGTTSMVMQTGGVISITTNGVNTGYFNSNGVLTVPGISATSNLTSVTSLYASGNVGIGTTSPGQKLSVAGTIESTSGGVKFPDGTTLATAVPSGTVGGGCGYNGQTYGNASCPLGGDVTCPAGYTPYKFTYCLNYGSCQINGSNAYPIGICVKN